MKNTHSAQLERWLGTEEVERLSQSMRGWYGPPIAIAGVPGRVYACGDGDFCGPIRGGYYMNLADYALQRYRRIMRESAKRNRYTLHGFSSLSDLISEATTGGKSQIRTYSKTGVAAPAVNASQALWGVGALPGAGANAAAAPGGTIPTNTTTGGLQQANATGGDTLHLTTWTGLSSQVGSVMLYDYMYGVNINHATTANTVTGVPTRYQDATAAGSFLSGRVTTVLGATAHNVTVTYVDQAGNAAEAGTAQAIRVSSAVQTVPLTQPQWFYNLNGADTGLRSVTSIALSAASTGNVDWFIGHPLAILPQLAVNTSFVLDGINSAFSLERVYDNACLALLELFKSATGAATISGMVKLVSG
jgi:hypothetical protein